MVARAGKDTDDERERFLSLVEETPQGCWRWLGNITNGYGRFASNGGRRELAHRAAVRVLSGIEPGRLCVCHTCDYPACVNPRHLFVGTQRDNLRDMVSKGRHTRGEKHSQIMKRYAARGDKQAMRLYPHLRPVGERNGCASITEVVARAILAAKAPGKSPKVAAEYGVSAGIVRSIWRGDRWAHLSPAERSPVPRVELVEVRRGWEALTNKYRAPSVVDG